MKQLLKATLITSALVLLTACGGGSDKSSTDNTGGSGDTGDTGGTGGTVNGKSPITPLTQKISRGFDIKGQNKTFTYQSGFDGDLATDLAQGFFNIKLKSGAPDLVVKDAQQTVSMDYTCENGDSGKGTSSEDLSSGKVVFSGTVNGKPVSCTETFNSPLPYTIKPDINVDDLFDSWSDDHPTSSTCPEDLDDETESPFEDNICSGSLLTNISVTDDNGKVSKVSQSISF